MQIRKSAHRTPVRNKPDWAILAAGLITIGLFAAGVVGGATESTSSPQDTSRLVSVQHLPGNMNLCTVDESAGADPDASAASPEEDSLFSALKMEPSIFMAAQGGRVPNTEKEEKEAADARAHGARTPVRTIRDTAPTYSAVAVDPNSNEVILQDNNLWQYLVFDRLSPTPAGPNDISQPKRTVRGDKTLLQFNNGLYVDPNGDIFSVESDTGDRMVRFPREASGDVPPKAVLHTPHRVYNLAADESTQEIFATIEYPPQVVVLPQRRFRRREAAKGNRGRQHPLGLPAWHRGGRKRPPRVRQYLGTS